MADREKVTRGLKCCMLSGDCNHCPYTETRCQEHLCGDALDLLKEQEEALKHLRILLNAAKRTAMQTEKIEKDIGWEDIGWLTEGL